MYVYLNTCVYIWYFGLKVNFFLIRYRSKYFFQNSCLYSFSTYTAVFLITVFLHCSTLNSLPSAGIFDQIFWIDRTACSTAAFAVERCKCLESTCGKHFWVCYFDPQGTGFYKKRTNTELFGSSSLPSLIFIYHLSSRYWEFRTPV